MFDIGNYLEKESAKVEKALSSYLPKTSDRPRKLHEAMRYAVLTTGGKRVRPILALAACQAVKGKETDVLPAACALELIHNYSLVHDDLPCMDDDATRRGKPTCHKRFDEETALLTGDALLTLAFEVLARPGRKVMADRQLGSIKLIADAIGTYGMVGGQAADLEFQHKDPDLPTIEYINTHKTGALIAVSTRVGGYLGGGSPSQVEALNRYGRSVGLLFQIVDDILDHEGYANSIGIPEARREAETLCQKAKSYLRPFGQNGHALAEIADFVLRRTF